MKMKIFYILFFLYFSITNAQSNFQNLALLKPQINDTYLFNFTGGIQKFIVPNKIYKIRVNAVGAKGGSGSNGQLGGDGANITTTLDVTPGQTLYIVVGGYPGVSKQAKYGYGGNGGGSNGTGSGGAGGGLSGIFSSNSPSNNNALVVAGGGGGGSGTGGNTGYNGGDALNSISGSAGNGEGSTNYPVSGRYQYGYGASTTGVGVGGFAYDNPPSQNGGDGNDLNGGNGGEGTIWQGAGGGGGGFFGGGGGAGGGSANGGGGGGSSKSISNIVSFGTANTNGNGSLTITTYDLAIYLDAGNSNSYGGSGTTWYDLSGNGSNATLNGVNFSSSNISSMNFPNGSYADFNLDLSINSVITVELWVKTISFNNGMYFGFNLYDVWTNNGAIGFNTAGGDLYGISSSIVTNLGIIGNWKHLVFVMYSGSKTNNKIYVNGVLQSLSQVDSTFNNDNANFNNGVGAINGWKANSNFFRLSQNLSVFKIYKNELSSQQILNLFNLEKSRFGL